MSWSDAGTGGRRNRVPSAAAGTPRCGSCHQSLPWIVDAAGRIKLVKVNVDSSPKLQRRFDVQSIPTLLVMRRGQVTARQMGAAPASALRAWVEKAMQES